MQGKLMKMGRAFRFALVCGVRIQSLTATSKPDTPFGVDVALVGSMQGLAEHNPSDSSAEPARLLSLFPTYPGPSLSGQGSFSAPTEHSGATMKTLNLLRDANSNPQHESRKRKIPGNMQLSEGVVADREAHLLSSGKETFKLLDSRSAFRPYKTPRISLLGSSRSAFRQWNGKARQFTKIDTPEQLQNLDGMITGRRWDGIDSGLSDGIHSAIASLPGDGKAVKEFNLGHLDFRFWAWISIIYVHVGGQVAAEFAFAGPSKRGMFEPWIGNEGFPLYQKIIDAMQPMIEDKLSTKFIARTSPKDPYRIKKPSAHE
ncbi:hypothetical protein KEM48_002569 [Puccinia striiformis f. sp. tritici PST-130]|nr:hypothetical protein KEM48_002569 [Puccinia striiformis f. sp. tritici PST-130]